MKLSPSGGCAWAPLAACSGAPPGSKACWASCGVSAPPPSFGVSASLGLSISIAGASA
jgi:hypothetical protein